MPDTLHQALDAMTDDAVEPCILAVGRHAEVTVEDREALSDWLQARFRSRIEGYVELIDSTGALVAHDPLDASAQDREAFEDARDVAIARVRLDELREHPDRVIGAEDLDARMRSWLETDDV